MSRLKHIRQLVWLLSTMTVHAVLSECSSIRDQIMLGPVMAGEQFLPTIVDALKCRRRLLLGHQKFGYEPTERVVDPYALRVWGVLSVLIYRK